MRPTLPSTLLSLLFATVAPLCATDYYVAGSQLGTGSGTQADPWRQVSSAISSLLPGDTVHVAGGTYAPFQIVDRSGTVGAPISIVVDAGATATIHGGVPVATNRDGIRIRNCSNIIVEGFTLVGTANPATSRAGISVQSDLGARLNNNDVSGNHENVTLRRNTISNYGYWGIFTAYINGLVIQENSLSGSVREHGLYISNASSGQIVRRNVVFNNRCSGIQLNGDYAYGGGGIISNSLVERNLVTNNGTGGGGALNNEGVQDSIFTNNILYGNHASGIVFWIGENGAPPANSSNGNLAVNNTVIQPPNGRAAVQIDHGYDNIIFNNILYHTGPFYRDAINLTSNDTDTLSDYNLVSPNFDINDTDLTLAQWGTATGNDAHSVVLTLDGLEDLFVDYAAHDYALVASATVAIDAGMAAFNGQTAPTTAFDGGARPSGAGLDIGAFEYAAAAVDPTPTPPPVGNPPTLPSNTDTDTIGPKLHLLGKKRLTTTAAKVRLRGTASDNTSVAAVEYLTKKGGYKLARGTTRWIVTAKLRTGRNKVIIRARDTSGNLSPSIKVVIKRLSAR